MQTGIKSYRKMEENNTRSTRIMDVKTYQTTIRNTQKKLEKARARGEVTRAIMLEKKLYDVKRQFEGQRYSVEQALPDEKSQHEMLEHIVIVSVLSDILSGYLIDMKLSMEKYMISGGDAYDNASIAVRYAQKVVSKLDECGQKASFALAKITEEIESKYMFGMVNDVRQIINRKIEWKRDF